MTTEASAPELKCSFCGKSRLEVKKLIAGPSVWICDECIGCCNDIIAEEVEAEAGIPTCPSLAELMAAFDQRVVAQAAAKRAIVAALRMHFARAHDETTMRVPHVLLVGPRGSGKTALGRALAAATELPMYHADVSRLSESGYVGEDVEHFVGGVFARAPSLEIAQVGVLFLDAMEKIKAEKPITPIARDISGEGVQRELHRVLDGLETELPRNMAKRHPQGETATFRCDRLFLVGAVTLEDLPANATDRVLRAKLRDRGLLDAIVARFDLVVQTHALSVDDLDRVLASENGLIAEAQRLVQPLGGTLSVQPEARRILAQAAFESGDGAWGLHPPMAKLMTMLLASSESLRDTVLDTNAARSLVA
jgi:ATP-dependent Clp protease ATP-binding subunit ClpX